MMSLVGMLSAVRPVERLPVRYTDGRTSLCFAEDVGGREAFPHFMPRLVSPSLGGRARRMLHEASVAYTVQMSHTHIKVNPRGLPRPQSSLRPTAALPAAVG
jgi:hypothetical protein